MLSTLWIRGLIRRSPARLIGLAIAVMLVVTFFSALGLFFSATKARMTTTAAASLPVDWQVQIRPGADVTRTAHAIDGAPGVRTTQLVGFADVPHLSATTSGTVQTTGKAVVLGLSDTYGTTFPGELRTLLGADTGVLLAQQTAANLQASVGTIVTVERPGMSAIRLPVAGIVDLPQADSLFQTVGTPPGTGVSAPPDNVIIVPLALWERDFASMSATSPGSVRRQVHVALSHALPSDPQAAYTSVLARAHNLEIKLTGDGVVGDNLAARLDAARSDAIYAQILFLFLGVPGVIVAALIAAVIAASGQTRRRRDQALLRIRGAAPMRVVRIASAEAALVGTTGTVLGLAGAVVASRLAFGSDLAGGTIAGALPWVIGAVALGLGLTIATVAVPAWRSARETSVHAARAGLGAQVRPIWERFYLDIILLALSGAVFWRSMSDAYNVVIAPEGVPTISINYLTLLAPMLLWLGTALLVWRLSNLVLRRGRRGLAAVMRPWARGLSGVAAASMSRQRALLSRGLVIVALTLSFAVSVAVFNTTYAQQARVDAQLTNGADVAVTTKADHLPAGVLATASRTPGVAAARPMQHRFAYVGNDLQDLYGIDPATIGDATHMSNAFFKGVDAKTVLAKLAATPDGILVSEETARDFQLQLGDTVRLRLQTAPDRHYAIVPFRYVGVVREFPTAPHDSFLVANSSYVGSATGMSEPQLVLVRTKIDPAAVATSLRREIGPNNGAVVTDIETELRATLSSLTAINLTGLTRLELGYAVLLAIAATGLVLALGLVERRRTFAIASALGAKRNQLAVFVWSEALFVNVGGVVLGALMGWGLSAMIVAILTGVFDPPPENLAVSWPYLAAVLGAVLLAVTGAGWWTGRATAKPAMEVIREL